ICSSPHQPLDHSSACIVARLPKRRNTKIIPGVYVCPCKNEKVRAFEVVPMRGPGERGRSVGLRNIHIDVLLEKRTHHILVLPLDRLNESKIIAAGGNRGGQHQWRYPTHGRFALDIHYWSFVRDPFGIRVRHKRKSAGSHSDKTNSSTSKISLPEN